MTKLIRCALCLMILARVSPACAQALWLGGADDPANFWSTTANWSGNTPPVKSTTISDGTASALFNSVAFPSSILDQTWSLYSLNFGDQADASYEFVGAALTVGAGGFNQAELTTGGGFVYPTVTFKNNVAIAAPASISAGDWYFAANFDKGSHQLIIGEEASTVFGAPITGTGELVVFGELTMFNGYPVFSASPTTGSLTGSGLTLDGGVFDATFTTSSPIPADMPISIGLLGGTLVFPTTLLDPDAYSPVLGSVTGPGTLLLGGLINSDNFNVDNLSGGIWTTTHTGGTVLGSDDGGCGCLVYDAVWTVGSNGLLPPGPITVNSFSSLELTGHSYTFTTAASPGPGEIFSTVPFAGHGAIFLDRDFGADSPVPGGTLIFNAELAGDTMSVSPDIIGSEDDSWGNVVKSGLGKLQLSSSAIEADFYLTAGTVEIMNDVPGDHIDFAGVFSMSADTVLKLNNHEASVYNLTGTGEIRIGEAAAGGRQNLYITGESTFAGTIVDEGSPTEPGQVGIITSGGETVTLSGVSTYHGATTVENARLHLTGSIANSRVELYSQGSLTGNGIIGGLLVSQGGVVEPMADGSIGPVPATLTIDGDVTFESGGAYAWKLSDPSDLTGTIGGNPGWDHLDIVNGGVLYIESTSSDRFEIRLTTTDDCGCVGLVDGFDPALPYSWTIATASGGINGFAADKFAVDSSLFANSLDGGSFSVGQDGNDLKLIFTPVPEPHEYALLCGLGLCGFAAWRRSRQRQLPA